MNPIYIVYDDDVISVALFAKDQEADKRDLLHLGIRWLTPRPSITKDRQQQEVTNVFAR